MFKELTVDHNSESFIRGWFIPTEICDALRKDFDKKISRAQFDETRGYTAFTSDSISPVVHKNYVNALQKCVDEYKRIYKWCNMDKNWSIQNRYNIQLYKPGNSYSNWHVEDPGPTSRMGKNIRHLVFTTYLNTVEEGGETAFMYQNVNVSPIKGLTVIWPAGWTHPHKGIAAPSEKKYIATGWCTYNHVY